MDRPRNEEPQISKHTQLPLSPLSRRRFLTGAALGAASVVILAACGQTAGPSAPSQSSAKPAEGSAPASAGGPKPGGNLHFLSRLTPPNLAYYGGGFGMFAVGNQVFDLLLSQDTSDPKIDYRETDKLLPRLAEKWDVQPDGLAYTFHLRKGVKWHDGTPFTAQDVVATTEYVRDPKKGFREGGIMAAVDKVEALDDLTVKYTMKRRDADFLLNLALGTNGLRIQQKALLNQPDKLTQTLVGTGPYKLESSDLSKATVLVKNPDYWEPGKPHMDRVTVHHKLDRTAEQAAFTARQFDIFYPPDNAVLQALKAAVPDVESGPVIQDLGSTLMLDMRKPPFSDVRFRRAVNLAIDRHAMNEALSRGEGVINAPGVWGRHPWAIPPDELMKTPGFRKEKDQDNADAKKLLADAGVQPGFKMTYAYPQGYDTGPKIAQVTAASLRNIGIDLQLKPLEDAVWLKNVAEGNYELTYLSGFTSAPTTQWFNLLHSKGSQNKGNVNDPQLDKLIEDQAQEMDPAKRKQIWLDIQRILLDKVYIFAVCEQANYAAWQPWVHDLRYSLSANVTLWAAENIWMDVDKMPAARR